MQINSMRKYIGPPSPIYILSAGQEMNVKQKIFSEFLRTEFEKINALSLRLDP